MDYLDVIKCQRGKLFFSEFYAQFMDCSIAKLRQLLSGNQKFFSEFIYQDYSRQLEGQLQNICLRTLIVMMHEYKSRGMLKGKTPEEESLYFCTEIVGQTEFAEFREQLLRLEGAMSRVLFADTQFYSMILSASYHPSLLMEETEREAFLRTALEKRTGIRRQIIENEKNSLIYGDIPCFYHRLDGEMLSVKQGEKWAAELNKLCGQKKNIQYKTIKKAIVKICDCFCAFLCILSNTSYT